ncbi:hypothetical protein AB7W24_22065 [Providencia rettgeri]
MINAAKGRGSKRSIIMASVVPTLFVFIIYHFLIMFGVLRSPIFSVLMVMNLVWQAWLILGLRKGVGYKNIYPLVFILCFLFQLSSLYDFIELSSYYLSTKAARGY